jgi:hypothetical protein
VVAVVRLVLALVALVVLVVVAQAVIPLLLLERQAQRTLVGVEVLVAQLVVRGQMVLQVVAE